MNQDAAREGHPALIRYPVKASFGRVLPKAKIYEHGRATSRVRDLFVKQVDQIVWQFKLAPETVNLPARPGVQEIQVFAIQLKQLELNTDVLRGIDGSIPFPILFELTFGSRTQAMDRGYSDVRGARVRLAGCKKRVLPVPARSARWRQRSTRTRRPAGATAVRQCWFIVQHAWT